MGNAHAHVVIAMVDTVKPGTVFRYYSWSGQLARASPVLDKVEASNGNTLNHHWYATAAGHDDIHRTRDMKRAMPPGTLQNM